VVSKAFQILSDDSKKRIYDQTGADPDVRGAGYSGGGGGGPTGSMFGGGGGGVEVSPEDLFNMFFGGGQGFGMGGFEFGPNVRVHTFGAGPFDAFGQTFARAGRAGAQNRRAAGNDAEFSLRNLGQLLPLLLLLVVPMLFSLFGESPQASYPKFEFKSRSPYVAERRTPVHNVQYYVNPKDISQMTDRKLHQLDRHAELTYVQIVKNECYQEINEQQRRMMEARGWFFVDQEAYRDALDMPKTHCDLLDKMGVAYRN
jgi:hypothetical protein